MGCTYCFRKDLILLISKTHLILSSYQIALKKISQLIKFFDVFNPIYNFFEHTIERVNGIWEYITSKSIKTKLNSVGQSGNHSIASI